MRTFILGAGASVHAGYPLGRYVWRDLVAWVKNEPELQEVQPVVEFVEGHFRDHLDNFEELLISFEQFEISSQGGKDLPRNFFWTLHAAITRYFVSIQKKQRALAYRAFAKSFVKPGDVIVTFNYDIEIERALKENNKWEIGDGYGFDVCAANTPGSLTRVLKLHGSTNWFGALFNGSLGFQQVCSPAEGERPFIPDEEFAVFGYKEVRDLQSRPNISLFSTLITQKEKIKPTWAEWWDTLWRQAREALAESDEIYILGYSLPETDGHSRNLILKHSNRDAKLTICAGSRSDSIKNECERCGFGDAVVAASSHFENWVANSVLR